MSNNHRVGLRARDTPTENFEPSGRNWVSQYRGSEKLEDLRLPFRGYVEAFVNALHAAGATVIINATYRPPKRAYWMHWSWKINRNRISPRDVPAMEGVPISWEHYDADGEHSDARSVAAARDMVRGFEMLRLGVAPSLRSRAALT